MKCFIFVLLLSSGLLTNQTFACSYDCVAVKQVDDVVIVRGFDTTGNIMYSHPVSLAETLSLTASNLSISDISVSASSGTANLADGGRVETSANVYTIVADILIVVTTAIFDVNGKLLLVDTNTKRHQNFE